MGIVGGPLAYWFLKHFYPGGQGVPMGSGDSCAAIPNGASAPKQSLGQPTREVSKLMSAFGVGVFDELREKVVLDFGCGTGETAIDLAKNGCRRVIGLDIQEHRLEKACLDAKAAGVADVCVFTTSWREPVDVIVSQDAFEHFDSPAQVLRVMRGLLKESGYLLVDFGPPRLHPYGGHLFSVFPWAHLVFTERALIRWRADFKNDGATRFHEVAGGLNRMTLRRWEHLVSQSEFAFLSYQPVQVQSAKRLHCFLTREFLTSSITARLTPRSPGVTP